MKITSEKAYGKVLAEVYTLMQKGKKILRTRKLILLL